MANGTKVGELVVDVDGNIAGLRTEMRSAVGVVKATADDIQAKANAMKAGMDSVISPIKSITGMLGPLAAGFGAILSINAFSNLINQTAEAAGKLHDLSMATGISVENLSAMASVGKLSDISLDQIASTANKMSKNIAVASEESKGAAGALRALNIDLGTFKKMSPDEQMLAVAKAMDNFADGGGKSAAAMAIMGKEGAAMIPFMKDLAASGELNARITKEQAAMADNYGDNLVKIRGASEAWKKQLALSMLPVMEEVTGAWLAATNSNDGLGGSIKRLSADGTFTTWARNAVIGVSYLVDVGHGLLSLLPMIGKGIAGMAAMGSAAFGAIYDAYLKIKEGDLSGAWDSLKSGANQVRVVAQETGQDIASIWNQDLLGAKIRKGMEEVRAARKEAGEAGKPQVDTSKFSVDGDEETKATKAKISAYDNLIKTINEKIAVQSQELESGQALTDAEKLASKVMVEIRDGVLKLTDSEKTHLGALLEKLLLEEKSNTTRKETLKLGADLLKSGADQIKSLDAQIEAAIKQNEEIGLTKEQIDQLAVSRLSMAAAADEELAANLRVGANYAGDLKDAYLEYANSLDEAAKKKRELASIRTDSAERQSAFDEEKRQMAERVSFWESLDKTAHDTFVSMWDSSKDAAQRMKDTFKNVFFDYVYQAGKNIAINVALKMSGGESGTSGSSGSSSMVSAGKTLWDSFSNASSVGGGISNFLGSSLGSLGSLLGSQSISAFASGLSGTAAGTIAGAGPTLAGSATGLGSLSSAAGIGEGFGVLATGAEAGSAAGAAGMGAGISSALAAIPVWGWAALAAAAVAAKFGGGKDRVLGDQSVSGTLGTNDISRNVNWTKDGGWFHGDSAGTWNYNLANSTAVASNGQSYQDAANLGNDQALLAQLNATYDAVKKSTVEFATALGINADSIAARKDSMRFDLGKTQEENAAAMRTMFGGIADQMASDLLPNFSEFAAVGETSSQTLSRLALEYKATDEAYAAMGKTFASTGLESIKAREEFLAMNGGIGLMQQNMQVYNQMMLSDAERLAPVQEALHKRMVELGFGAVTTWEGFKDLVTGLDRTKVEQAALYIELMKLAPAFQQVAQSAGSILGGVESARIAVEGAQHTYQAALNAVSEGLQQASQRANSARQAELSVQQRISTAYFSAQDAVASAQQRIIDLNREAADSMTDYASNLRSFIAGLSGSTTGKSLASARSEFLTTADAAKNGDALARERLTSVAQKFLQLSEKRSATGFDYTRDEAMVKSMLGDIADTLDKKVADMNLPKLTDPMQTATADLAIAQARLADYAQLAQATGSSMDRSLISVSDSVVSLLGEYRQTHADNVRAQNDYATAQQMASGLLTTAQSSQAGFLGLLDQALSAKSALIKSQADLSAAILKVADSSSASSDEFVKSLGLTGESAALLSKAMAEANLSTEAYKALMASTGLTAVQLATELTKSGASAADMAVILARAGLDGGRFIDRLAAAGITVDGFAAQMLTGGLGAEQLAVIFGVSHASAASFANAMGAPGTAAHTLAQTLLESSVSTSEYQLDLQRAGVSAQSFEAVLGKAGLSTQEFDDLVGLSGISVKALIAALGTSDTGLQGAALISGVSLQKFIAASDSAGLTVGGFNDLLSRNGLTATSWDGLKSLTNSDSGLLAEYLNLAAESSLSLPTALDTLSASSVAMADLMSKFQLPQIDISASWTGGITGQGGAGSLNQQIVESWYKTNVNANKSPDLQGIAYWVSEIEKSGLIAAKTAFADSVATNSGTKAVDIKDFGNGYLTPAQPEVITARAYSPPPMVGGGGTSSASNNAELVAEIRRLREDVKELQKVAEVGNQNVKKTYDVLNYVTQGGNAMRTEAIK
ncbi:hypothetical protein [Undibacterium sp. Ji22W]|uniref:hypothetical protein n=1 Tax=Undibacterium sp. Ji22W TaxID=3413038 RepID=UPI003BF1BE9E